MPNHVTTRCCVTGPAAAIAAFRQALFPVKSGDQAEYDGTHFDFNGIVPMPAGLADAVEGTSSTMGASLLLMLASEGGLTQLGGIAATQVQAARARFSDADGRTDIGTVAQRYLAAHPELAEAGRVHLWAIVGAAEDGTLLRGEDQGARALLNAVPPTDAFLRASVGAAWLLLAAAREAPYGDGGLWDTQMQRVLEQSGLPHSADRRAHIAAFLTQPAQAETLREGVRRLRLVLETGYASWYPWSLAHWGTKWNAYSTHLVAPEDAETPEGFEFVFDTAWSFPTPIFEALAAAYSELSFDCATYDEGGNFAGEGAFNPREDQEPFAIGDATDDLYERVYGHPPEREEEDPS